MSLLPVRLEDLVHARTVESVRIEFKKTWNYVIRDAVMKTIAAFANDFQGLNGGYVVLGIEAPDGRAELPPHGLDDLDLEKVQKEIAVDCQKFLPPYVPLMVPEVLDGKTVLVIYAPISDGRPHQAPESGGSKAERRYYVRIGAQTKEAKGAVLKQLLEVTTRIPFDERRRSDVSLSVLSPRLLARYLADVGSDLTADPGTIDVRDVLRRLRLSGGVNGTEGPRNAALLFFTDDPEDYFRGCAIEVAQFRDDAGGDLLETRTFRGPLDVQVTSALDFLSGLFGDVIRQSASEFRSQRFVAYPTRALREAIVNAVYHRSYEGGGSPTRIGIYPDRVEITSYPGPVAGLERQHLQLGAHVPQVPARNPRIGEMLKLLRLAETWRTGVPKIYRSMTENGSPAPVFDFDEERTYFRVTLPAHPGYVVLHAQREAAALWFAGERERALERLSDAHRRAPASGALAAQLITYLAQQGELDAARKVLVGLEQQEGRHDRHLAYFALAAAYLDARQDTDASALLEHAPSPTDPQQQVELAILNKRSGELERAHQIFSAVARDIQIDPRALHEWAQVKLHLAGRIRPHDDVKAKARQRLLRDALDLLSRVIDLAGDQRTRTAWAWFDTARARQYLRQPRAAIAEALDRALALLPGERRFLDWRDEHLG